MTGQVFHRDIDHSADLADLDSLELLEIEVDQGMEMALQEMESLSKQLGDVNGETLVELCRENIINTVVGQFGLASLMVDARDGGSVTTTHNFEKGITASQEDAEKYQRLADSRSFSAEEWKSHRGKAGYDDQFSARRKKAFNERPVIVDEYTGRALPKDGRAHLDHVVSAREIDTDAKLNLHMSLDERVQLALSDENLAFTDHSINQSKGNLRMADWLDKERKSGETNVEYFGIDKEMALERDTAARKHITTEANKKAIKKYSKELLSTGAKDAARVAAYSALGIVLRDLASGILRAIRVALAQKRQGFKNAFVVFKEEVGQVVKSVRDKWKHILAGSVEAGITAFLSNIAVFVVNLFATTLKKLVAIIRAGFVSLVQALKVLVNPPAGMSPEEARFEAVKVMVAGVVGAASLGLNAAIENMLLAIPGLQPLMMIPIPAVGGEARTVSDALAVTLSAVFGGVVTTIAIYLLDSLRTGGLKDKLEVQLLAQSGLLVQYSSAKSWFVLRDAYTGLEVDVSDYRESVLVTKSEIDSSLRAVDIAEQGRITALEKLRSRRRGK